MPFIDRGTPVEYELVRAICTVEKQKRKRMGVVETDAPVFGRFSMQGQSPSWQIIDDLKKQYEVIPVSPSQPIPLRKAAAKPGEKEEGFDVLVVIQPSAMGPPECNNLIAAIRAGQPTVLFEDPFSILAPTCPAPRSRAARPTRCRPCSCSSRTCKRAISSRSGKCWASPSAAVKTAMSSSRSLARTRGLPEPTRSFSRTTTPIPSSPSQPEFVFLDNACGGKGFDPFNEKDPISFRATTRPLPHAGTYREAEFVANCSIATSSRWCALA